MYDYKEQRDIWLFQNDYSNFIYDTDEGRAVLALLKHDDYDNLVRKASVPPATLKTIFNSYWNARNNTGSHIDSVLKTDSEVLS